MGNIIKKNIELLIGNFDGIHIAHQKLINKIKSKYNLITFENIPNKIKAAPLFSPTDKAYLLKQLNVDAILTMNLKEVNITSKEFNKFLIDSLSPSCIYIGSDFKYGSDNASINSLKKDFKVINFSRITSISTTKIKSLISNGKIKQANKLLISPFFQTGSVIKCKQLGTKLGFPTANIIRDKSLSKIKPGVYYGKAKFDDKPITYDAALVVTNNKDNSQMIEAHIINKQLPTYYGHTLKVSFLQEVGSLKHVSNNNQLKITIQTWLKKINKIINSNN